MKNYVTQKMRGIRRMVWFWSWLVVMLAMTEVSWGQGIPLYAKGETDTPPIGTVAVSVDETKTVHFSPVFYPGFENKEEHTYLNIQSVDEKEYAALMDRINAGLERFEIAYTFAPINSAEALGNILKHCATSEDAVSYSGNTVTVNGTIEFSTFGSRGDLNFVGGSIVLNMTESANINGSYAIVGASEEVTEAILQGGNLTINGKYSSEKRCEGTSSKGWRLPIIINSGYLNAQHATIYDIYTENDQESPFLTLNGGNVKLSDSYIVCNIKQNNGSISFNNIQFHTSNSNAIEMNGGTLLIDKGLYRSPIGYKFLNITGNAEVEIIDGYFSGDISDYMIYQQTGTVTINNGLFGNKIKVEGGTLNVKDMQCMASNSGIEATGSAKVSIEGGLYSSDAMIAANPNQMLAPGYSYFTRYQEIQPGLLLNEISAEDRELVQVKPTSSASTTMNNCIEAAKTANVGPEGTDVKVVTKQDGEKTYSEYEVYTEKGLAWIATACNQSEYNYRYDLGLSEKEYSKISSSSRIVLMADMDMSEYDWIPFRFIGKLFDGQGHTINGLNVTQAEAAFINYVGIQSIVANVVIANGKFNAMEADHSQFGFSSAAGLVIENTGTIVNCGVQASSITGTVKNNIRDIFVGGLASINTGSIENSYVTGDVVLQINQMDRGLILNCDAFITAIGGFVGDNTNGGHKMYIGFTGPSGRIENCYHAGGVANLNVDSDMPYVYEMMQDDFAINEIERSTPGTLTNCTTSPELESLNNNVSAHVTPEGGIAWKKWTTVEGINMGYPIHGENAVSAGKLTILSEGPGEFKGSYGEETFVADTTVSINGASELKLTATPDESSTLLKVVSIRNNAETVIAGVDAGQAFAYTLSSVSDTLKAYFGNPDMIIEEAMLVSGHTNGQNIVIDVPETAVLDFENVVIDNVAPKTTVKANSEVIIRLSGANNLGTLLNEGTTILQSEDESASLIADIENNGIFSDETGMITSVSGPAALEIEPLSDYTIEEGETVTLSVTVYAEENSNLDFQWLRKEGNEWVEIIPTRSIEVSSTLEVREAGLYRCLITNTVDGVMTVLNAYSEVEIAPAYEPEYPDIPEEPVANEAIAEDETRVYTQEGKIIVVTPNPQEVQIVSMNGSVIATAKVAGQQAFDGMNEGTYIVRVGEDVIKIQLKL